MHPAKSSHEIDLIEWIQNLLSLLRRSWPFILLVTVLGLALGIYLILSGKAPGKPFYRQSYFLISPIDNNFLIDICNSIAASIRNSENIRPAGFRNIETRLSPTVLKESRIKIEFSVFDTNALPVVFILFENRLVNHAGFQSLLKSSIEKNKSYMDDVEKQLSTTCHGESMPVDYCLELQARLSQLRQTLHHSMPAEFIVIDENPVVVSQHRERNLFLTGMSLTALATSVMLVFLSRYFFIPQKGKA
jgi:hypothetical protein